MTHWYLSSCLGLILTGQFRPLCAAVYAAPDSLARRAFLRVADRLFAETDHCRRIAITYRLGRALRDGRCRHNTTPISAG